MEKPSGVSAEKPRALFLSPESPYPLAGGGPLRSASLLEYLRRRYTVDVILFQQTGSANPQACLPAGFAARAETIWLPYHSRQPVARAARNAVRLLRRRPPLLDRFSGFDRQIAQFVAGRQYDLAVIEHFWCAPYVDPLRQCSKIVWLDLHNVESAWHQSLADASPLLHSLAHRRFAEAYSKLERSLFPKFGALLVTSENDAVRTRRLAPGGNVVVYPNALPCLPPIEKHEDDAIAFSGNLEYEPNRLAVQFFKQAIWPLLRDRWPLLEWRIIGKNPQAVAAIVAGDPRIRLVGPVDDAVVTLSRVKVAVVPLLAGSGTRMKILEAWSAETPVVSTSIGAEGLEYQAGQHLLIADDPNHFAGQVSLLLESAATRQQLGQMARQLCQERYTWSAAWKRLDAALGPPTL